MVYSIIFFIGVTKNQYASLIYEIQIDKQTITIDKIAINIKFIIEVIGTRNAKE